MSLSQSLQKRPFLEGLDDVLVAVLAEAAAPGLGGGGDEGAGLVHGVFEGDAGGGADAEVVLAVGGGVVDEAGAVLGGDVRVGEDDEGVGLVLVLREDGLVADAFEVGSLDALEDFGLLFAEDGLEACLGEEVDGAVAVARGDIVDVRAGADGEVGEERPGGGGPDEEVGGGAAPGRARALGDAATDGDGGILDVFVVAAGLEVGEGRGELPRVGHDAVALVDAALVPKLLEGPPDALHEGRLHGLVIVVEVHPAADARDGLAPLRHVAQHHGAALLVEGVDAVPADFVGAVHAQGVLGEGLDGQAVAVPAEAPLHVAPAHGLVPRDDVLDDARQEVAVVGEAGGEGGAVIEAEDGRALAPLQAFGEGALPGPLGEDGLFILGEVGTVGDGLEHGFLWCGAQSRRTARTPSRSVAAIMAARLSASIRVRLTLPRKAM